MYLVTLSWRVIPHAVGRFCEIKDGDKLIFLAWFTPTSG